MIPTLRSAATALALSLAALTPAMAQDTAATTEAAAPQILPDIVLGQEDAPLTVIEYASFTCSHCRDFHNNVFPTLKSEYIDTGKVRFIQRDVYFDGVGLWAGILARCGGDDKYYAMSDLLFSGQNDWLQGKTAEEVTANMKKVGAKAGLSGEQMDACWNDQAKAEQLIATFQQNATADQIEGTPTFIIGGEKTSNQPWEGLKAVIDAKLAEAEG
ncbi:MAG: DsbA family protein [Paracoccus sp. (in: a-proteobacteria)]|uniref:DsbA family protein n=1 Tax=Paracoccus sp. TaxID=267 RepID=UPI0026DF4653|nr:DsbA family protein [Paracoccus sp. (in: a-proteobacteria)]MDO5621216.1 DsbA family protein [Paracoccus sp. (in: a-proteobacteria)]